MIDNADLTLPETERRVLIGWTIACAERLIPVFAVECPDDTRLRAALEGARQFAAGQLSIGPVRKLAFSCHAAAREAKTASARAVARLCGQAVAVAHMAGHSRRIDNYTRKALAGPVLTAELAWQRANVPERFRAYVYGTSVGSAE